MTAIHLLFHSLLAASMLTARDWLPHCWLSRMTLETTESISLDHDTFPVQVDTQQGRWREIPSPCTESHICSWLNWVG